MRVLHLVQQAGQQPHQFVREPGIRVAAVGFQNALEECAHQGVVPALLTRHMGIHLSQQVAVFAQCILERDQIVHRVWRQSMLFQESDGALEHRTGLFSTG